MKKEMYETGAPYHRSNNVMKLFFSLRDGQDIGKKDLEFLITCANTCWDCNRDMHIYFSTDMMLEDTSKNSVALGKFYCESVDWNIQVPDIRTPPSDGKFRLVLFDQARHQYKFIDEYESLLETKAVKKCLEKRGGLTSRQQYKIFSKIFYSG